MNDSPAPRLETPRLVLRGHRPEDHPACAALWATPEVVRFIGGQPLGGEDAWGRMLRYLGLWHWFRYGFWVIENKAGEFVGEVGFANLRRDSVPSPGDAPELGYALLPSTHGKGFATEAVQAAHRWIEATHSFPRTVCMIAPENTASLNVAAKCGYANPIRTLHRRTEMVLLERPRGC